MFTHEEFKALSFDQKKEVMGWKAKFHHKKSKATAEMKRIPKNGFNKFHNYAYAQESDVKDHVREILRENNLSVSSDLINRVEVLVKTKQGEATKTDVQMDFTLTDCETGYFETYSLDGVAIDNGDKGSYKAYTATIKYFLMNEFLIPTGDDVEVESPQMKDQQNNQNRNQGSNQGSNQQRPNQSNQQQRPQQTNQQRPNQSNGSGAGAANMPTWKHIMNAEGRLVYLSGKTKTDVRVSIEHHFGKVAKYKELDEDIAVAILKQLKDWIAKYEPPQGTGEANQDQRPQQQN